MYNGPFFIRGFMPGMMPPIPQASPTIAAGSRALAGAGAGARGAGLLGRLGSGFASLRSINWSGLINGTSKTLGVINQTIPLVKQVGPVMNNMKSMLRVASAFKDETDNSNRRRNTYQKNTLKNNTSKNYIPNKNQNLTQNNNPSIDNFKNPTEDYSPTFFIHS